MHPNALDLRAKTDNNDDNGCRREQRVSNSQEYGSDSGSESKSVEDDYEDGGVGSDDKYNEGQGRDERQGEGHGGDAT